MNTDERNWYDGLRCRVCQGTQRYVATGRCVACRQRVNREVTERRRTLTDDRRKGLGHGFIQFGTVQCDVLRWVHENRPCLGHDVAQALGLSRSVVAMALKQLVEARMLYRHGLVQCAPGRRSGRLFSTDPDKVPGVRRKRLTGSERTALYRQRKRLKVATVFDWRGSLSVTGK